MNNDQQLQLKLMGRVDGPALVPQGVIMQVKSYRAAVVLCWIHRRVQGMTKASLCEQTGMRPCHVSQYLSLAEYDKHGAEMREMPAKYLPAFEALMGNTFPSQWLATQSKILIVEALIPEAKTA